MVGSKTEPLAFSARWRMRHAAALTITVVCLDTMITMVCATYAPKMRRASADTKTSIAILGGINSNKLVIHAPAMFAMAKR